MAEIKVVCEKFTNAINKVMLFYFLYFGRAIAPVLYSIMWYSRVFMFIISAFLVAIYSWNYEVVLYDFSPPKPVPIPQKRTDVTNKSLPFPLLFYNRIPKAASTTVLHYINQLKAKNKFVHHVGTFSEYSRTRKQETFFVKQLLFNASHSKEKALVYSAHMFFVNAHELKLRRPNYINVVRDPMEREISRIYYALKQHQSNETFSLEKCLENQVNNSICPLHPHSGQICFFVGSLSPCASPIQFINQEHHPKMLQMAKSNIEQFYSVVGIAEDLENSFKLFEVMLPRFFKGLSKMHKRSIILNKNSSRPKLTNKHRQLMFNRFDIQLDLEIYQFVKQRFGMQQELYKNELKSL